MNIDELRSIDLFRRLSDDQLGELLEAGAAVPIEPGVELWHEADLAEYWWVLVAGDIELLRHAGREHTVVGRMTQPGQWAGGFRAWDEHGAYLATGRGARPGHVLRIPAAALRDRMNAWLPLAGHLIQGLYGTARSIESTARQREALVALGTLTAGLAHEINNPAAAAGRAVGALGPACDTLLDSLRQLADDEISAGQFAALDELRREVPHQAAMLDPLDVADQEDALIAWLDDHGVRRGHLVAPPLAAAGVDLDWCARVAEVLPGKALEPGLQWVAAALSARSLLTEAGESVKRVSELVAAVRSYSQLDRASMQLVDVTDGLESTLVMLGHKLRDAVTVVREYAPDAPRITAYPGELNQVWTNLINNAVDAMDGVGTLRLATLVDGDEVVVEVADTGPGMPPEIAARAFDAFFTTKEVGKGTGLGLDIARRIVVERHGGAIAISSRPGETVMRVTLPVRPAEGRD